MITLVIDNIINITQSISQADFYHKNNKKMSLNFKKLGFTENLQPTRQMFMPEQLENIKLNNLRQKRRQLQQKLKMISNRINFKRKKEQQELKRYIRTEERSRVISETKIYKKMNSTFKEEKTQKQMFQLKKKAKQVEDFRTTNSRRLNLIYQSVKDRKMSESEKLRQTKKMDQEVLYMSKQEALNQLRQKRQNVLKMKQRQVTKRKCYYLEKRLSFQQSLIDQTAIYEKQIQEYYKKINDLKNNQESIKQKKQQAEQILRCAQQNYELLRHS